MNGIEQSLAWACAEIKLRTRPVVSPRQTELLRLSYPLAVRRSS